jgi:CO/xanthine dehydrogenase Mo-binding subunit
MDQLHDALRTSPSTERELSVKGDVAAALAGAAKRVHATYRWPYQMHASIGPSCAVADVHGDGATIWSGTQGAHNLAGAIAALLELPPEKVHVIWTEASGCYGHNGADDAAADAALLSQAVGRPVRVQWMREDEHAWEPKGPAMVVEAEGGVDAEGRIAAWRVDVWTPTHTGRPNAQSPANLLAGRLMGLTASGRGFSGGGERNARHTYDIAVERIVAHHVASSHLRTSSLRGLGSPQNSFANESFMDELAAAARVDPIDFRLRHMSDPRAIAVLQAAARLAAWVPGIAAHRATRDVELAPGRGVAYVRYDGTEAYVAAIVDVEVDRKRGAIRVPRVYVAHDCGLVVNPDGLRNQIEGNVIQAISRTLKEEVRFDRARITSIDWNGYPILRFGEVPDAIDIAVLDRRDQPSVGAGEAATSPIPAAIGNAVYDATGVRLRTIPLTPKRVLGALRSVAPGG